ncbi:hypothetical protein D3C78_17690 [compost metagenome]
MERVKCMYTIINSFAIPSPDLIEGSHFWSSVYSGPNVEIIQHRRGDIHYWIKNSAKKWVHESDLSYVSPEAKKELNAAKSMFGEGEINIEKRMPNDNYKSVTKSQTRI